VDKRPARLNRAWLGYVTNDVGIDEFVALCRKLNAEPYVCVNVSTGTPEEAAALVEYANGASDTRWGRVRAENGHPEPYHIKAWNLGNEEWHPPLAGTRGKAYGETFEACAKAMRAVDPSIELVAVGLLVEPPSGLVPPESPARKMFRHLFNWNEVLPIAGQSMNAYSIHSYEPTGEAFKGLSGAEISRAAMASADDLSAKLDVLQQQMKQYSPGGKIFPVAPDEWSVGMPHEYLPPNASAPPLPAEIKDPGQLMRSGSFLTLRAAVGEAAVYNLMQRRPKEFVLANRVLLYGHAMGIVGIGRDRVVASPPALNLELYSTYDRCESLSIETKGPTFDVAPRGDFKGAKGANLVDASARLGSDGKTLEVFLVNRDIEKDIDTMVRLSGGQMDGPVEMARLNAPSLTEWNSFENPDRVKIEHSQLAINHGELRILLPAHSISKLKVRLK
jgi:alpha-N-arabinofuranosidase